MKYLDDSGVLDVANRAANMLSLIQTLPRDTLEETMMEVSIKDLFNTLDLLMAVLYTYEDYTMPPLVGSTAEDYYEPSKEETEH